MRYRIPKTDKNNQYAWHGYHRAEYYVLERHKECLRCPLRWPDFVLIVSAALVARSQTAIAEDPEAVWQN